MQALKKLGLPTDIPVKILLSDNLNDSVRVLSSEQKQMVSLLRDVVSEYNKTTIKKKPILSSRQAFEALRGRLAHLEHEESWVMYLNQSGVPIASEMMSRGSMDATALNNREIISKALAYNAKSFILFHNHPSGNPKPSESDMKGTERLKEAADTMDIRLLDHIIIAGDSYYSFSDGEN